MKTNHRSGRADRGRGAVGCSRLPAARRQAAGSRRRRVVEVEKLKDNLFVLRGGGGNTAVFVQTNGVTVVDTKNPGWGQPILDKIKELTPKPVTTIINTHTHGDHVSGNVEFPATVDIVDARKHQGQHGEDAPGRPASPSRARRRAEHLRRRTAAGGCPSGRSRTG